MKKALEDILKIEKKITGRAAIKLPELFSIDAESPRLDKEQAEKYISFRSGKHKLFGGENKTRMSNCYLIPDDPSAL